MKSFKIIASLIVLVATILTSNGSTVMRRRVIPYEEVVATLNARRNQLAVESQQLSPATTFDELNPSEGDKEKPNSASMSVRGVPYMASPGGVSLQPATYVDLNDPRVKKLRATEVDSRTNQSDVVSEEVTPLYVNEQVYRKMKPWISGPSPSNARGIYTPGVFRQQQPSTPIKYLRAVQNPNNNNRGVTRTILSPGDVLGANQEPANVSLKPKARRTLASQIQNPYTTANNNENARWLFDWFWGPSYDDGYYGGQPPYPPPGPVGPYYPATPDPVGPYPGPATPPLEYCVQHTDPITLDLIEDCYPV